jgi:hypothetical protein
LSAIDSKIKQRACIKFCVKLGKSATETLLMLCEAFGEHSLSRTAVFECIHISRPVECQLKMTNIQGDQAPAEQQKMFKKFDSSSMKTVTEQSMSLQTPLGSVTESARIPNRKFEHALHCSFITTMCPPTCP